MVALPCVVSAQTISGTITDAITGVPIQGANVRIMEKGVTVVTNDLGIYKTDTLSPGTYFLKIDASHYLRQMKKAILASQSEVGTTNLFVNVALYNLSTEADSSKGNLTIKYMFPIHDIVEINIYNDRDKLVKTAIDRTRASGMRTFLWNAQDNNGKMVPGGTYTCRIKSGHLLSMRTLVVKAEVSSPKP